jgi:formate hydrogenlyase subunit 3/multisubunit Na+/H+ antiporter MnhD subunit
MLILSLIFLLIRSSPIFFWIALELNLIFVLFIIFEDASRIKAITCYFVFQIYGSFVFIYGFIRRNLILLAFLGLGIKFGLFPFHMWQPYVFGFSSWKVCLIIAGPQKAFLILLCLFLNIKLVNLITVLISLTIIITNFYLIFIYDLKKIFAFLSIRRATWLLCLIGWSIESNLWFLFLYNIQLIIIFIMFLLYETHKLEIKKHLNLLILIFIVSYSGLPPFIGFFMKVEILNFFFALFQNIFILFLFRIILIPSTFFLTYYRIKFFLNHKLITFQRISLFYIFIIVIFLILPTFYI